MVCRFLITSPDSQEQWRMISNYLDTHYPRQYNRNLDKRVNYLMILLNILAQSSAYAIEQAKSLYSVIKAMIDWVRNEMKEQQLEHQQSRMFYDENLETGRNLPAKHSRWFRHYKGEPSEYRGWNRKYAAPTTAVPNQPHQQAPKLNQHIIPANPQVFTYRQEPHRFHTGMSRLPPTLQNPPPHQPRQAKKQPHPVEYLPYSSKGFSLAESRLQPIRVPISSNPRKKS